MEAITSADWAIRRPILIYWWADILPLDTIDKVDFRWLSVALWRNQMELYDQQEPLLIPLSHLEKYYALLDAWSARWSTKESAVH